MLKKSYLIILIPLSYIFISLINPGYQSSSTIPPDSLLSHTYISSLIKYNNYYPYIRYENNFIEWTKRTALLRFFSKLPEAGEKQIRILHIGDSHVQADIGTGNTRDRMQEIFGFGGRGLIFPYRSANTHSAWDYRTFSEGSWEFSRNIDKERKYDIGLSGVTIHTEDEKAGFKIVFKKNELKEDFSVLKLFVKQSQESFNLKLKASSSPDTINISCNTVTNKAFIEIQLPSSADTLHFLINKNDAKQKFLEFYGLSIESKENKGILYSSVGINGAGYKSVLNQNILTAQLIAFNPDLIIIDLGANDFYKGAFNYPLMEQMLSKIIREIKYAVPETSIIINSSQNFYRRKVNVEGCISFSEMTRKIALTNECGFYDFFDVAGGNQSMLKWLSSGLAKQDRVHLTNAGYLLKAELFCNAMLYSYSEYLRKNDADSLISSFDKIDSLQLTKYFPANTKYGKTSEKQTTTINTQTSDKSGKTLTGKPVTKQQTSGNIKHKVRQGESLWSISQKYNTTVAKIKKLNNLKSDKLQPGMMLIVK